MKNVSQKEVENLIRLHPDLINFGTKEDAVDDKWIKKAEERLGVSLTYSYKWFLKNYRGGEVCGDEIYSIYGVEFDNVFGGDIVYHYIMDEKRGLANHKRIFVCRTDFGEQFFFDYSRFEEDECPVCLMLPSNDIVEYAADFYVFLYKKIMECIS